MSSSRIKVSNFCAVFSLWILVLSFVNWFHLGHCQDVNDYDQIDNPAVLPLITQLVYSRLSNLTTALSHDISNRSSFCVQDPWVCSLYFGLCWVAQNLFKIWRKKKLSTQFGNQSWFNLIKENFPFSFTYPCVSVLQIWYIFYFN